MVKQKLRLGTVAFSPKGKWNAETEYKRLNVVHFLASSYYAKKDNVGQSPTLDSEYWGLLVEGGDVVNNPDEEDITTEVVNNEHVLKLADKEYRPENFSGKGYKRLRKNIQKIDLAVTKITVNSAPTKDGEISVTINNIDTHISLVKDTHNTPALVAQTISDTLVSAHTDYNIEVTENIITLTRKHSGEVASSAFDAADTGVTLAIEDSTKSVKRSILTDSILTQSNFIYEIKYDFDLNGETISVPENSTLSFLGGSLKNGKIVFNNTVIEGNDAIFDIDTLQVSGTIQGKLYTSQFGYYPNVKKDISPLIKMVVANGYTLQFDKGTYYISETYIPKSDRFSLLGVNEIGYNTTTIISPFDNKKSYHYLLKLGGMKDFTQPSNYDDYSVHDFSIDNINFQTWGYVGFNNEYADTKYNSQACGCLCLDFCVGGYLNIAFEGVGESLFLANSWEIKFEQIKVYGSYIDHNRSAIYFGRAFTSVVGSNISAIAISYILAENLGGSLLATSNKCNAADVFIGTIAYERAVNKSVYKKFSKETINYIIEKKNELKKIPLLDLRYIGITIGNISDSSGETTSCTVFKENDEEFICNNLRAISSNVTIANFNISNGYIDFWELANPDYEPQIFVGNLCFSKSGNTTIGSNVTKNIYVIQTTKHCGTVQIGNYSGRIVYDYDDVIDISNKYIDISNIRRFIPDIYTYNHSILYKIHGTTLNGIEKDVVGVHLDYDLKLKAKPKQVLSLYLMATWMHDINIILTYYKDNSIVYTQTVSSFIGINKIQRYDILLANISYEYFTIKSITTADSMFLYAIECTEHTCLSGSTNKRPTEAFKGLEYYDTDLNKKILWNGTAWVNLDGSLLDVKKSGTTAERPTNVEIGFIYKDTTLNKLILWEGTKWVNLDGSELS